MKPSEYFKYIDIGLPEDIRRLKEAGYYDEAMRLMDVKAARPYTPDELKYCFNAWKEIFSRTYREFPLSFEDLMAQFKEKIPDITAEELKSLEDDGLLRWIYLNGEKRYFKSTFRTVMKSDLTMAKRAGLDTSDPDTLLNEAIKECKENGSVTRHIHFTRTLRIADAAFHKGMKVRVHIPIPADCMEQTNIKIEATSPKAKEINKPDAENRCAYFEETLDENRDFKVTYSYDFTNVYHNAYEMAAGCSETGKCIADEPYNPGEEFLCEEGPHIRFTPIIRALAERITCGCKDKSVIAKRIYDYLTLNLRYTFTPNYLLLPDIVNDGALFMRGDCGVMALLFITLCRVSGVGARWQSGLTMEPTGAGQHDWAEVFLPEFGWIPVDVSYGVGAHRYGAEERRRFYFGNLDPYRMVANNKFMGKMVPEKNHFRNDPYDNQDGEIESEEKCLREDDFDYFGEIEVS